MAGFETDRVPHDLGLWFFLECHPQSFDTALLTPKDIEIIEVPEPVVEKLPLPTRYASVDEKKNKHDLSGKAKLVALEPYVAVTGLEGVPTNEGEWADNGFLVRRSFNDHDCPNSVYIDVQSPQSQQAILDVFWEECFEKRVQVYVVTNSGPGGLCSS